MSIEFVHLSSQGGQLPCGTTGLGTSTSRVDQITCPKCREIVFYGPELTALRGRIGLLEAVVEKLLRDSK